MKTIIQEFIDLEIPKGFMNTAITIDNYFIADNNDSKNWDKLKLPLPKGNWKIYETQGKKITLIKTNAHSIPPEQYWDSFKI